MTRCKRTMSQIPEEKLKTGKEQYGALVGTTGTGYDIISMDGKAPDANQEYVRLKVHRAPVEKMGRNVNEWIDGYGNDKKAEAIFLNTGITIQNPEEIRCSPAIPEDRGHYA